MTQQGQSGAESAQWWKVAQHLDEAQLASVNALASNVDDPSTIFAFQEAIRQAQALLLEIFRAKGLLPAVIEPTPVVNAPIDPGLGAAMPQAPSPPPGMSMPAPPPGMSMPMPPMGMSMPMPPAGMPMPPTMAAAFDPFDPVADQELPRDPAVEVHHDLRHVQAEPSQDPVEATVPTPDVTVVTPEVSAQGVDVPEAEA